MIHLSKIKAFEAWDITTGDPDIKVCVIDDGVNYEHPDLNDNLALNKGDNPLDSVDNDNDGLIDNTYGWDFSGDDNNPINPNTKTITI